MGYCTRVVHCCYTSVPDEREVSHKREMVCVRRSDRNRPSLLTLLLLVSIAGAGVFYLVGRGLLGSEEAAIAAERMRRLIAVRSGQVLSGTPDLRDLDSRLKERGVSVGAPVFIRVFKREFELELWMRKAGRYVHLATYPICRWSGKLGPKLEEGDKQSPEGFYTVDRRALNPNSRWHRSFNLGFPNVFDRAHARTGSYLMVHGGCSSVGCYAMTNAVVDEIWRLVTAALGNGQRKIHVHAFPFRMTEANFKQRDTHRWAGFWSTLKEGYDAFEATHVPPRVTVCKGQYHVAAKMREYGAGHGVIEDCSVAAVLQESNPRAGGQGKDGL